MRYWGNQPRTTERKRRRRSYVASPGSLRNPRFLRKLYRGHPGLGEGLQRLIFLILASLLLYAFVLGDGGAVRIYSLQRRKARVEEEIERLRAQLASMEREIELLRGDPEYIEKLGRERYGLIYPGERVIKRVRVQEKRER